MQRTQRTSKSRAKPATKSKYVPAKRRLTYPKTRTYALAAPLVGLGASATTVLRTSFFANCTGSASTGIFTGFLKPGSAFDPTGDQSTVQPQMFDQFAQMYSRYKVNSCIIRMKITGASSGGSAVWVAAAYPAVDSTALTTYQAAASQQYAKTTSGCFQQISSAGTGAEGKYLSFNLNHNDVVGARSDTWDIGAPVTADPTTGQFMVLPFFIQANGNTACAWVIEVDILQNTTFSQKKNTADGN